MSSTDALKACFHLEEKCAEFYRKCSRQFPEAQALFRELAIEEENHAVILKLALVYAAADKLDAEIEQDDSGIGEVGPAVDEALRELDAGTMTLKKALELSLLLEESLGERYLREMLAGNPHSRIMARLQEMLADEGAHLEKVQAFIAKQEAGQMT